MNGTIFLPADVPTHSGETYKRNYISLTRGTKRLLLLAGDQKIEHLNDDFYSENLPIEVNDPKHLFRIASDSSIGGFATQLGLIARYGHAYPDVQYIAKLNSKTNSIDLEHYDPISKQLWSIHDVLEVQKNNDISIAGVGFTVYIGSKYETEMLQEAAQVIFNAHQHGLIAILWMYMRGKTITNQNNPRDIAGLTGLANALGADFVKIKAPNEATAIQKWLPIAVQAAGNTGVICAGGPKDNKKAFLTHVSNWIHLGNVAGAAVGRNIFQHSELDACVLAKAAASIIYTDATVEDVLDT